MAFCNIWARSPVYCDGTDVFDRRIGIGLLGSSRMLRHIIALPILLLSVLAAAPALACGPMVPSHDCCPDGPIAPCAPERANPAEANRLDVCCAAGGTVATPAAVAMPSKEFRKAWDRADLPTLLVAVTTLATAYTSSPAADDFRIVPRSLSYSTLYLSTGRLRL